MSGHSSFSFKTLSLWSSGCCPSGPTPPQVGARTPYSVVQVQGPKGGRSGDPWDVGGAAGLTARICFWRRAQPCPGLRFARICAAADGGQSRAQWQRAAPPLGSTRLWSSGAGDAAESRAGAGLLSLSWLCLPSASCLADEGPRVLEGPLCMPAGEWPAEMLGGDGGGALLRLYTSPALIWGPISAVT